MRKSRILIIEDEIHVLALLAQILKKEGHRVIKAVDGKEGLALFEKYQPDLVITDYKMPEKDGFEVIQTIKKMRPQTGVIMLSGRMDEVIKTALEQYPLCDYLSKPLESLESLNVMIERMLVFSGFCHPNTVSVGL